MKKLLYYIFLALLVTLVGCISKEFDPQDAPKQAMIEALQKLEEHDYDAYMLYAYLGEDEDSVYIDLIKKLLNQHQEYQEHKKGHVANIDVVDVKFANDSICTVLYQLVFSDSTKEVSSQKMVCVEGDWKIRIRN